MLRELLVYDGHQVCSLRKEQYSVGVHAEAVQRVRRPACMHLTPPQQGKPWRIAHENHVGG